jgi:hypothetical protein
MLTMERLPALRRRHIALRPPIITLLQHCIMNKAGEQASCVHFRLALLFAHFASAIIKCNLRPLNPNKNLYIINIDLNKPKT